MGFWEALGKFFVPWREDQAKLEEADQRLGPMLNRMEAAISRLEMVAADARLYDQWRKARDDAANGHDLAP